MDNKEIIENSDQSETKKTAVLVCDIIPFLDFAKFFEKVTNSTTGKERISMISHYFTRYRKKFKELHGTLNAEQVNNGDSIFSLIRLLLPTYDRTRAAYNIKSTVLGRMYGKILGLSPDSTDGIKLIKFKDPGKVGNAAGDLGSIVYVVLEKRFSHVATNGPTLGELHRVLDKLARAKGMNEDTVTQEKQIKILQSFFRRLSPIEGKWLTKIILKAVKLDLSHTQILNLVNPHAKDLLKTMSLEQICLKLNDPDAVVSGTDSDIVLFNFFRPMLCARLNNLDENISKKQEKSKTSSPRKKDEIALPTPPFVIETKWDGERFQIHYKLNVVTGMHTFKYFSRQGFDFTSNFEATLSSRLKDQIVTDIPIESFILDGEMMAWRKDKKTFTQKGGNIDVKRMNPDNVNHCPTFVAFDIVYYNGEVLIEKSLMERIEILKQILHPKDSVCQLSEQKLVHSKTAVVDALNVAIDNLEEGLVVKTINSIYEPGQRISTWLKIKPEYIDASQVADLDLLILGAYYTDSIRRGGIITHFLAGLVQNNEFWPLVKLGSGSLGKVELETLVSDLQPNFVNSEISTVKYSGRKRPDFFIDPKKSIVVQVKATEILYSKEYELNYTLRFARIIKVRRDKSWQDAMSVKDFHQLRVSCEGKLAKRTDGLSRYTGKNKQKSLSDSEEEEHEHPLPSTSKGKMSPVKKTISPYKSKVTTVGASVLKKSSTVISNIFTSHVFNVVGSIIWKEEMELKLHSHGGEIVQNPTNDLFCVIAEKESLRVQNIIIEGTYNVVKDSWVDQCISTKQILPFQFENMFYANKQTKEGFMNDYDEFGDSYTKKSNLPELKRLIHNIINKNIKTESTPPLPNIIQTIKRQINEDVFLNDKKFKKWSFLSECKIAFRGEMDLILSIQIQFYGGIVAKDELEKGTTHVILGEIYSPQKKKHLSAFVVKRKWLLDSLEKKQLLSELPYTVE